MTKVKICGLSRIDDITAVNRILPDFIGFVFAPSRRRVDINTAAALKDKLDPRIKAVGVFVNEDIKTIAEIYQNGLIDLVQLHGDEGGEYILRLKINCGCRVIKSIGIGDKLPPLPDGPDYLLFDSISELRGGAGKAFDRNVLRGYLGLPYFLSGGLSPDTVSDAIRLLSPYCVDVSSGVETDGKKDAEKIEKFVRAARQQGRDSSHPAS